MPITNGLPIEMNQEQKANGKEHQVNIGEGSWEKKMFRDHRQGSLEEINNNLVIKSH